MLFKTLPVHCDPLQDQYTKVFESVRLRACGLSAQVGSKHVLSVKIPCVPPPLPADGPSLSVWGPGRCLAINLELRIVRAIDVSIRRVGRGQSTQCGASSPVSTNTTGPLCAGSPNLYCGSRGWSESAAHDHREPETEACCEHTRDPNASQQQMTCVCLWNAWF